MLKSHKLAKFLKLWADTRKVNNLSLYDSSWRVDHVTHNANTRNTNKKEVSVLNCGEGDRKDTCIVNSHHFHVLAQKSLSQWAYLITLLKMAIHTESTLYYSIFFYSIFNYLTFYIILWFMLFVYCYSSIRL